MINPSRTRQKLQNVNLGVENQFPLFVLSLNVEKFRSISQLGLNFIHPLTVLTGTNKIGKTSILAMLACSHVEFQMRNLGTGNFERCTWNRLIKFTKHDQQLNDWRYKIKYKTGFNIEEPEGWRLAGTKKWSGLGKKTGQITNRRVVYIDIDRITPAHACSNVLFLNTQHSNSLQPVEEKINGYFRYIFETEEFNLEQIAQHQNRTSYRLDDTFTNFNSASGEDVLLAILLDAVQADPKSLVLIDELELGLHPKIQRRLVDVLMDIANEDQKQFIVTTHSPSLLSAFDQNSRIFIEKKEDGNYR
jgi:predicted ATPase